MVRQVPSSVSSVYGTYGDGGYCWLLFEAGGGFAPLCPIDIPPSEGLGSRADYRDRLDIVEIAPDVTTLACDGEPLDIVTDVHLDHRRFAVTACDNPA